MTDRIHIGICAGFGSWIGSTDLDLFRYLGFAGVRQEIDSSDPAEIASLVAEFADAPLRPRPLFCIGSDDADAGEIVRRAELTTVACQRIGVKFALEIGNEPDNARLSPRWAKDPAGWGLTVQAVADLLPGVEVVSGGIQSTSRDSLLYLSRAVAYIPQSCIIGVHTYRSGPPQKPLDSYESRNNEWTALRYVIGQRRIWVTEVGWDDWTKRGGLITSICGKPLTPAQVADNLREEIRICAAAGVEAVFVYQFRDGTGADEHFGIRTVDGGLKPSAYVAKEV